MSSDVKTLFNNSLDMDKLSDKQKSVLKASLELFSEKGFDRTNSSDIATLAGVAEGTVYKQFKTKEGILQAILTPIIQQVVPMVAKEFLAEIHHNKFSDFEDFLKYFVDNRVRFALENGKQLKILIQEVTHNKEILQILSDKVQKLLTGDLNTIFDYYKKKQQLVDWPNTRIFRFIVSTTVSYPLPAILLGTEDMVDIEQADEEIVQVLIKGLAV